MTPSPCPHRQVDAEGRILCDRIHAGDRAIDPQVCAVCPLAAVACAHLRATLANQAHPPLLVRYGNGQSAVWQDTLPPLTFTQAACAALARPIRSASDCGDCRLRQPLLIQNSLTATASPAPQPSAFSRGRKLTSSRPTAAAAEAEERRLRMVERKIIQLDEWLAQAKGRDDSKQMSDIDAASSALGPVPRSPVRPKAGEEKRVGWTD